MVSPTHEIIIQRSNDPFQNMFPIMKRIQSMHDLQSQKSIIQQEQDNLRKQLKEDWQELKESAKPINIVKAIYRGTIRQRAAAKTGDSLLNTILSFVQNLITGKIMGTSRKK